MQTTPRWLRDTHYHALRTANEHADADGPAVCQACKQLENPVTLRLDARRAMNQNYQRHALYANALIYFVHLGPL